MRASAHPDGLIDLSVGSPVDPVPDVIQEALRAGANAPGYPRTQGTQQVRDAAASWLRRRLHVEVPTDSVLPVSGTKEMVAWLPTLLGVDRDELVVVPELAYPTYEVGALLVRARVLRADSTLAVGPAKPALVWLNSPANPTGQVLPVEHLRKVVAWARANQAIVVSDECYIELGFDAEPVSVLHPAVCDNDHRGLLALHSLSKRSNLAGYRAGFVAGDAQLIASLVNLRKHVGGMVASPVQAAMVAALNDDEHAEQQRECYRRRRTLLRDALFSAGFRIDHSEAGLYLWATRNEPCWTTVAGMAQRGILVAPGDFYGPLGASHVRVSLTAPDDAVKSAASRLAT